MLLLLLALTAHGDPGARALALATRMVEELGPRPAPSPASEAAQRWVEDELRARGWSPRRIQPQRWSTVVACRPGEEPRVVLFLAHTDTVHARVPGANDNAAAVAVLLVAAEELGNRTTPRTVCLAFPDAEEIGLRGSLELSWVAERELGPLDQVMALDLVGRGWLTHHGLGPVWGEARLRALLAAAPADVPWVYRGISQAWPRMERSDHLPFTLRGLPASHLMARSEAGVDWAYHTPADQPDRLELPTLRGAVRAVVGVASAPPLPEEPGGPAFVAPRTAWVGPAWLTWVMLAMSPVLAAAGLRPTPSEGGGALSFVGRSVCASAAAGLALGWVGWGRPLEWALADPAVIAAWGAWGLVVLAWPDVAPRPARVLGALAALGLAALLYPAPLLALPCALAAAGVGLSGASGGWLGRLPALIPAIPALYLLRPDAVRELAFHGLVPATVMVWTAGWLLLTAPVLGVVWSFDPRARRILGVLFAAALLLGASWGWTSPVASAPWLRGEVLWPGAP